VNIIVNLQPKEIFTLERVVKKFNISAGIESLHTFS